MIRTDPHRPGALNPDDYELLLCYAFFTQKDGWPIPPQNIDRLVELRRTERFVEIHEGTNRCDVCGAYFIEGELWRHVPTGDVICLGHQCADKYEFCRELGDWARERFAHVKGWALRAERHARKVANAKTFGAQLRDHARFREAIRRNREHPILADMTRRALKHGSLTDAQVNYAVKLLHDLENPRQEEVFEGTAASGRNTVEARILAVKDYDSHYQRNGVTYKMLVAVEGADGTWKAWGTCPAILLESTWHAREAWQDEIREAIRVTVHWNTRIAPAREWIEKLEEERREIADLWPAHGAMRDLRGARIRFAAKFEPADDDPHFARFSRPTKPALLALDVPEV